MTKKVLFICKNRVNSYGISYGLINSANFLCNYFNSKKIESKVATVLDSNGIDKEVYNFKPTHVIIHALFVPPYKIKELTKKYKNINWVILIHSKISFLSNEGIAMEWIKEYDSIISTNIYKNLFIAVNNIKTSYALNSVLSNKVLYLPNIYYHNIKLKNKIDRNDNELHVGCFGAVRPFKNHLIQAIAAIKYANKINKKLKFFVNSSRIEQKGESVVKNLRSLFENTNHELVELPWVKHEDFIDIVSKMDLGMQLSFTETFNIVAADFVYCKIPLVVSSEIDWMPFYSKAKTQDIKSILNCIKFNTSCILRKFITKINLFNLNIKNNISKFRWFYFIK